MYNLVMKHHSNFIFVLALLTYLVNGETIFAKITKVPASSVYIENWVCNNFQRNLSIGSKQPAGVYDIQELQRFLRDNKYLQVNITGYYGPATKEAVKKFQTLNLLKTTGILDLSTRTKIKSLTCLDDGITSRGTITNSSLIKSTTKVVRNGARVVEDTQDIEVTMLPVITSLADMKSQKVKTVFNQSDGVEILGTNLNSKTPVRVIIGERVLDPQGGMVENNGVATSEFISIPFDMKPGIYELRVATEIGNSNPLVIEIKSKPNTSPLTVASVSAKSKNSDVMSIHQGESLVIKGKNFPQVISIKFFGLNDDLLGGSVGQGVFTSKDYNGLSQAIMENVDFNVGTYRLILAPENAPVIDLGLISILDPVK
jgi:hypothetical protein